jgi:hypothetical protein
MNSVNSKTAQDLLGHKRIAMSARCSDLAPAHQRQAVELIVPKGANPVQNGEKLAANREKGSLT